MKFLEMLLWAIALTVFFAGCGSTPVSPEDDVLSQAMALSGVNRSPVTDGTGAVVGVTISADVINTGPVPITQAFVMTWRLLASGSTLATGTYRFSGQAFESGERRHVALTLHFPARSDLSGIQDAVTFAFE